MVKIDSSTLKQKLYIYDSSQTEVASITKKAFTPRLSFSSNSKNMDFSLEVNKENIGTLKSKYSPDEQTFKLNSEEWSFIGVISHWEYTIYSNRKEIAYLSPHTFSFGKTYFLDFPNPNNELMLLLLIFATNICNTSEK